jgi:hypothetical protein
MELYKAKKIEQQNEDLANAAVGGQVSSVDSAHSSSFCFSVLDEGF